MIGVVEEKDPRHAASLDGLHRAGGVETEVFGNQDYGEYNGYCHANSLEGVGPEYRLHAAPESVSKHYHHTYQRVDDERQPERAEYHELEGNAHHEQPDRCSQELGNKEKPCSGFVRGASEPVFQILVYGHHVLAVEDRYEYESYYYVSHQKSGHHLHVTHCSAVGSYHSGHRYVCDPGHGRPDHGYGYDPPWSLAPAVEKVAGIAHASRSKQGYSKDEDKPSEHREYHSQGTQTVF